MEAPVSRSAVPDKHQYVKRAARKPLRRSCKKSGSEGAIVVERVRSHSAAITTSTMASTRRPSRTRISGPGRGNRLYQVIRAALQNASSMASLVLTTEAMICEIHEELDS
jgi:chaperonin GroEL